MSSDQVTAVIIAAAQSVAKVFCIGALGWTATLVPRANPLLPLASVPTVARFSFHVLTLALIYSTTAQSVNLDSLGDYWFLVAGAWGVLALSYATATGLGCACRGLVVSRQDNDSTNNNNADFRALRIAATFPNIVALPILIFPSLCEFEVVYRGYYAATTGSDDYDDDATSAQQVDASQLQERCEIESNTMIFCYFFSWSLAFWTVGYPQLMAAATKRSSNNDNNPSSHTSTSSRSFDEASTSSEERGATEVLPASSTRTNNNNDDDAQDARTRQQQDHICAGSPSPLPPPPVEVTDDDNDLTSTGMAVAAECQSTAPPPASLLLFPSSSSSSPSWCRFPACCSRIAAALRQTFTSPGFLALFAGVLTGCVPPLQRELFEPAGALRFLGDALETLGSASSPMSTLVVAASLVPAAATTQQSGEDDNEEDSSNSGDAENDHYDDGEEAKEEEEGNLEGNPIMSDPNFGPARRRRRTRAAAGARIRRLSRTVQRGSAIMLKSFRTSTAASPQRRRDMRRLLCWFILSRLVVAPALVVATIVGLECSGGGGGLLTGVPQLAKLVVIVNSCLPGALIVVVLLKSNPSLSDSATAVAQVYLPSYLLSIVTIAAWTAVGLYITLPDEDGNTFCHQY